mmetsp:Transcript_108087/g.315997  ORF Transcript_108087/g.315997 Transcript_108087/m.315997 type:complete len:95 (+) Transcript_108087:1804-2088(+)
MLLRHADGEVMWIKTHHLTRAVHSSWDWCLALSCKQVLKVAQMYLYSSICHVEQAPDLCSTLGMSSLLLSTQMMCLTCIMGLSLVPPPPPQPRP